MNPQLHDEFVTLVPLFYSGELTDQEWALLQVHMAYCDPCREAFEQYQHITSHVVPAMAASLASESPSGPMESDHSLREAEQDLISRLDSKPDAHRVEVLKPRWGWIAAGTIAACVAGGLMFIGIRHLRP